MYPEVTQFTSWLKCQYPTSSASVHYSKVYDQIFTHNNVQLSNRYCQSRLKTIGKKCGIHVTPHQLRHTCATMLLNAGMSIFGVQVILGHKHVDTTLKYARTHEATVAKTYQEAINQVEQNSSTKSLKQLFLVLECR